MYKDKEYKILFRIVLIVTAILLGACTYGIYSIWNMFYEC